MKPKKISISLNPDVIKFLDKGKYNKSKLIDSLLEKYFKNNSEKSK